MSCYMRTKKGDIYAFNELDHFFQISHYHDWFLDGDTIEDLIQEGDLVKYVDLTTQYPYKEEYTQLDKFFKPHHSAIYRVIELYTKQDNGDWKLVAKDKGNYKLELM